MEADWCAKFKDGCKKEKKKLIKCKRCKVWVCKDHCLLKRKVNDFYNKTYIFR